MTVATKRQIKPCGVAVEGIFYPWPDGLDVRDGTAYDEWKAQGEAYAAKLWQAIGPRRVDLARKGVNPTLHAIRTEPRGYGKRRKHWAVTTECGQIMYQEQGWQVKQGVLGDTTCLSCRTVVRERREMEIEYGVDTDEMLDAYEEYAWQQLEEMWRIQAEWHKPDPVTASWVGEGEIVIVQEFPAAH